jgi:large subunit ribosomal protein L9
MPRKKREKKIPVLLLEDLPNLGQRGEVVLVKPGYYRYLLFQGKIALATKEKLEKELKPFLLEEKIKSREREVQELKEKIEKIVLEFKINQYTSVTKEKIIKALKEKGFEISRAQIELREKIKEAGEYNIPVNLGYNIFAQLKIKVSK